ncbi:MAG: IS21/IS408/IS1162 family transposase [Leptospirillum sp.]
MGNRRIEMFEIRNVLVRMRLGDSDRDLSRSGLIGRRKAAEIRSLAQEQGWLDPSKPLPDDTTWSPVLTGTPRQPPVLSSVTPWAEQIRLWVDQDIPGTTIYQALARNHGYTGSYSSVRRFIRSLPQEISATVILDFKPGEAVQVDFGAGPLLPHPVTGDPVKTWIFVMTLCFSRHQYAEIVTDPKVGTWLAPCPPRDPKKKGLVESGVKYVKSAFLPLRTFRSLADANQQLRTWILSEAGNRIHGTTRRRPLDLFTEGEKALLSPLPDRPVQLATWVRAKVHGDAHVVLEANRYSVPYTLIRATLWIKSTDTTISVFKEQELVAIHPRLWGQGQHHTLDDHLPPNALAFKLRDPQWCLRRAQEVGPSCRELIERLFSDRVLDNLRAAQGVLRLAERHGASRVETACARALSFDNPRYRTVKLILDRGLDLLPLEAPAGILSPAYTGSGRFSRPIHTLFPKKESFS